MIASKIKKFEEFPDHNHFGRKRVACLKTVLNIQNCRPWRGVVWLISPVAARLCFDKWMKRRRLVINRQLLRSQAQQEEKLDKITLCTYLYVCLCIYGNTIYNIHLEKIIVPTIAKLFVVI